MIKTVGEFAAEKKMPVSSLLEQLNKAGVKKSSPFDMLTGPDKTKLLDYLRQAHSSDGVKQSTGIRLRLRKETDETVTGTSVKTSQPKDWSDANGLLEFIVRHKIPIDRVFDARGMGPSEYGPAMSVGGYEVAVGVTPCKKGGHAIRTRAGECAVCNPAALAFQKRFHIEGYVYLAHSEILKLVKVGFSRDVGDRQYMLNLLAYGGTSDWRVIRHALVENGGAVELLIQQRLAQYKASAAYLKQGAWVDCNELFQCGVSAAVMAFEDVAINDHAGVSPRDSSRTSESQSNKSQLSPPTKQVEQRNAIEQTETGLSKDQLDFLVRSDVPLERVFNAKGMGPGEYGAKMKEQGKWVAFNTSPCTKAGHRLKDRFGHCVQCDPSNISYVRRHYERGTVYVAFSPKTGLVKVGMATRSDRVDQLNGYRYGGASDWRKLHTFVCERAGKVESLAHLALDQFRAEGEYFKNGDWIACKELFKCDIPTAVKAVEHAMKIAANK